MWDTVKASCGRTDIVLSVIPLPCDVVLALCTRDFPPWRERCSHHERRHEVMFWESPEEKRGSQLIGNKKTEQTRGWIRDGFTLHHSSSPTSDWQTIFYTYKVIHANDWDVNIPPSIERPKNQSWVRDSFRALERGQRAARVTMRSPKGALPQFCPNRFFFLRNGIYLLNNNII
jgi:hypothetical protein